MIDLHCHFLPAVDDGARTSEEALALAAASVSNGITHAVLTPHVYPGVFDNRVSTLTIAFEQFRDSLKAAGIPLNVMLGGEVRLHPDAFDLLAEGDLPFIGALGDDRILLLEFPDAQIPAGAMASCRFLAKQGVRPLIAHPERNKDVMRDPTLIKPFVDAGCLLQLTAASVIGRFGAKALETAHYLLAHGWVSVIATDAHNMAHRPPLLRESRDAIASLYGSGLAHRLTQEIPAEIVGSRLVQQRPREDPQPCAEAAAA